MSDHVLTKPLYRILLAAIVALLLVACTEQSPEQGRDASAGERATPVAAMEVQPRDLSRELRFTATVEPRAHIRLASRISGTLDEILVDEGDAVEGGQALARLDMSEQRAELARARSQEEEAQLSYRRTAELRESGVVSVADYQRATVARQVAQAERELWETRLRFGTLRAPEAAMVSRRYVEAGEAIEAQATVFELITLDQLVLRPGVSELDVVHLAVDDRLPVRFDALPDLELEARLHRIAPMADGDSRLVTIKLHLPADAAEHGVRPGFLARARMAIDRRPDALAVPAAALAEDEDGHYLYRIRDDRLERRRVTAGVTRDRLREITDGLEPGDIVLASNPLDMQDGDRVRIVGWRD